MAVHEFRGDVTSDMTHKGDLRIQGNVMPGVRITVEDGGLLVDGNVSDGASLTQRSSGIGGGVFIGGGNSSVIMTGGGVSISGGNIRISGGGAR